MYASCKHLKVNDHLAGCPSRGTEEMKRILSYSFFSRVDLGAFDANGVKLGDNEWPSRRLFPGGQPLQEKEWK